VTGGMKLLLATASLAVVGCADSGELKIRAIADPLTKAVKPGNPLLGEARGLLALGNVGLAIEAYRKVLRAQPDSIEALAGLAECYDQMGRHDLARVKYEAALAIAPKNPLLLRTFAASLERQGRRAEGLALRAEANLAEADEVAELERDVPVERAAAPPRAVPGQPMASAAPATIRSATPPATATIAPAKVARSSAPPQAAATAGVTHWTIDLAPSPPSSVTVKLPPASPPGIQSLRKAIESAWVAINPLPPAETAKAVGARAQAPSEKHGPRLERLSLGEVALVTKSPLWKTELVHRTAISTTVRFVPLTPLPRLAGVRLLNAARQQGLAARTRVALNRGGWNRVSIGDADRVRQRSLVLYSTATAQAARRLAAEFGFGIARDPRPGPLTVLLGRDSVGRAEKRS
jgi:Flp pilus assembly protein TadD